MDRPKPPRTFADATDMPARWTLALQMRAEGATFQIIAEHLGVTNERAQQIVRKAERRARELRVKGLVRMLTVCAAAVLASPALSAPGIRVIDGDTIDIAGERVRILNIDTPERRKRARCSNERVMAERASQALEARVRAATQVDLQRDGRDRYGRTLARVYLDGRDVGEDLIGEGHAVRWGRGRPDWCLIK